MKTVVTGLLHGRMAKTFSLFLCAVFVATVFSVPVKAVDDTGDYWVTKEPIPPSFSPGGPDRACAGVAVNGKVYVIGGYGTFGGHTSANQEYDPATDTWATKASMPTARSATAIGVVNGKVYVLGGNPGLGSTNVVEEYDPETDTWTTKAPMPTARFGLEVGVVNGKIYAIGGFLDYVPFFTPTAVVEMYDPLMDTWTTKASMLSPRGYFGAGVVHEKIYAVGGYLSWPPVASNEEYDPATDTWTAKAPMAVPRSSPEISVVNNRLYVIGGVLADNLFVPTNEEYNPATDQWTTRAPMFTPRTEFALGVVNNKIYAIGGWLYGVGVNNNEEYTPPAPEDPETLLQGLITTIDLWYLPKGIENSLISKLTNAQQSLDNGYQEESISQLNALINEARAQRNKKLTSEQADIIIEEVLRIIAAIQG